MAKKKPARKPVPSHSPENRLTHDDFRQADVISFFLGDFESEDELDAYLHKRFPVDFGFKINPRDAPEMCASREQSIVDDLLSGFSQADDFVEPVARALVKDDWHRASTAVVFYNFCYNPKAYDSFNVRASLKFVGTFHVKSKKWVPADLP